MSAVNSSNLSLAKQIKNSSKIFGPISGAFGFVSDVISPITPFIHVVTVICGVVSVILFIFYLLRKRNETYEALSQYFSQFFVFTSVLIFFWVLQSGSEKGFLADNFESVASLQTVIVKNVGFDQPAEPQKPSYDQESYYLDIANNQLRTEGGTTVDKIVNGIIYFNNGHYDKAVVMLDSAISEGQIKYDLLYRYYESLFYVHKGDLIKIDEKITSSGLSENPLMKLAKIDFLHKGIDFYKELDLLNFDDPLIKSFGQNLKAKSLLADLNHYYLYESYALEYWVPILRKNQEALGKNLININSFFFDYQGSYRNYLNLTTHHGDEHFVWDWPVDDPEKRLMAEQIWKRIQSGDIKRVLLNFGQTVSGRVVDANGAPLSGILISDFDAFPKISSKEVFTGTTTDDEGRFTLISGSGHLLRFSSVAGDRNFSEVFKTVKSDSLNVTLQEMR